MRPNHREPDDFLPRMKNYKKSRGRKRYAIECRWRKEKFMCFYHRRRWSIWKRYRTEKARDRALYALKHKGPSIGEPCLEYRKEPEVKIRPLHDNIIVEHQPPSDRSKGGIVLPAACKTPPTKALVIAVGPGKLASNGKRIPMPCKEGDTVLVSISGEEIKNPDPESKSTYRIIKAEDVLGVGETDESMNWLE